MPAAFLAEGMAVAGGVRWPFVRDAASRVGCVSSGLRLVPRIAADACKGFVLAECLRLEEESLDPHSGTPLAGQLAARLAQQLPPDEAVFSLSSPVLNSPHLTGQVTPRTALEAMIAHSDNTATDMVLRHVGPERVQDFIDGSARASPRFSPVPASWRQ